MGLPLACVFADHGANVIACDANPRVVDSINRGAAPFEEPGLSELLSRVTREGRLRATTDTAAAARESEVITVIVPVKLTESKAADLSIIESVAFDVAKGLRRGSLVTFETTLPVGQTRKLGTILETGGLRAGIDFDLAFSPERVKSQLVLKHLTIHPKIVGGITPEAAARAESFCAQFLGAPVINVGTLEAAEFVKLAGMIYRDVNIALANELANYAHEVGLDFETARRAANTDGEAALLSPGIGVGGHCTPVYPYFLIRDAEARGIEVPLSSGARRLNEAQPAHILDRAGDIAGKRVLILGLGFRPQVKEPAYSPAFGLRDEITRRGGVPALHDPLFSDAELMELGFDASPIEGADVVVLNTAHDVYKNLDFRALAEKGVKTVIDGRDNWDAESVEAAGLRYIGIGRLSGAEGRASPVESPA
jgi:nucleotide sugar dehydrogenase